MAVYAIGDLQGCYDPFRRLLDKIDFDPANDRIWLVGDLVNRGPKSLKTLRFVKSLGNSATIVLGNHDLHLLALANDIGVRPNRFDSMWKVLAADDCDELLDWLRALPLAHYSEELDTLMVHAGLPPQWTIDDTLAHAAEVETVLRSDDFASFLEKMYGDQPNRWSDKLEGKKRLRFIVNCLTRVRMMDTDGTLDFQHSGPPRDARKGLLPWYRMKNAAWRGTRIVFGHWSALGLLLEPDLICVDTGCVWGRALTAVRLTKSSKVRRVKCC